MKRSVKLIITIAVFTLAMTSLSLAGRHDDQTWTFESKEKIDINTVGGDCEIARSTDGKITISVDSDYRPKRSFSPRVRERSHSIRINEDMQGSTSGYSTWRIEAPDNVEIDFNTASGDLYINGFKGIVTANTASGEIIIEESEGEFEINTASGDIYVDKSKLTDICGFNTASGTVEASLTDTPTHDLVIGTASGRAILDCNGKPIKGTIEMTSRYREGRIIAPFDFDDEEVYRRYDQRYITKIAVRETEEPFIRISTASGKAVLK